MITLVSGLPRSGTSLVMQMVRASGYPVYFNKEPNCDDQNPRGYYEWEEQKSLWQSSGKESASLWGRVDGKAAKVFPQVFPCLSPAYQYQIIYVDRPIGQIINSQRAMQVARGRDPKLIQRGQLQKLRYHAMIYCAYFRLLYLRHEDLYDETAAPKILRFLFENPAFEFGSDGKHQSKLLDMLSCVDSNLRHHQSSKPEGE